MEIARKIKKKWDRKPTRAEISAVNCCIAKKMRGDHAGVSVSWTAA